MKLALVLERGLSRATDDEKLLTFGPTTVDSMKGAAEPAETTDPGR